MRNASSGSRRGGGGEEMGFPQQVMRFRFLVHIISDMPRELSVSAPLRFCRGILHRAGHLKPTLLISRFA